MEKPQPTPQPDPKQKPAKRIIPPLSNYTLSSVCPACQAETYKQACKVKCPRCGFMWDCSEL